MAEQIISPGVFTRENDLSFLPQGVGQIGAAIIGPTEKGPAFVPTVIRSFSEFERRFGPLSSTTYVPQTVREYLKNAGSVTVCRVLAGGGYTFTNGTNEFIVIAASGSEKPGNKTDDVVLGVIYPSKFDGTPDLKDTTLHASTGTGAPDLNENFNITLSGSGVTRSPFSASVNPANNNYLFKNLGYTPNNSKNGANQYTGTPGYTYLNWKSLQKSIQSTVAESQTITFGTSTDTILTASLQNVALSATGGFYFSIMDGHNNATSSHTLVFSGSGLVLGGQSPANNVSGSIIFVKLDSSTVVPALTDSASFADISTQFRDEINTGGGAHLRTLLTASSAITDGKATVTLTQLDPGATLDMTTTFAAATASVAIGTQGTNVTGYSLSSGKEIKFITQSSNMVYSGEIGQIEKYGYASTPYIQSQISLGRKNLFKFHTLNHGKEVSKEYKISLINLKEPSDIDGLEQYSQFSIILRSYSDKDKSPVILEQYNNVTLDPNSPRYIARVFGDRYPQYNDILDKVELLGNYPNISNYCRVEVDAAVAERSTSPKLSPKGFAAVTNAIRTASLSVPCTIPSASYETIQQTGTDGTYNSKGYLGWKFNDKEADNDNWIKPLPDGAESNVFGAYSVENHSGHVSSSLWSGSLSQSIDTTGLTGPKNSQLKFTIPFQGGDDGIAPYTIKKIGQYITANNLYGFDLSTTATAGYKGYKKAINILSNQDEYDINMLAMPGVIHSLHPLVTNAGIDMSEERGDCFYVMDLNEQESSVNTAVSNVEGIDTNYAAVYYPWVKVLDSSINKPILVPPSVIVPGAIAASDRIGAEWFAPAGLNRGILGNVIEAKIRLNQAERDTLYDAKINPIATFPQTGICIWGQKTLQERSTALDRINVRRLLIALKKFIASSSRYLVFEQNTLQTRTRFLNIVNPYLESVQQRQGLYAFRIQMDESNNTPDVIDRNQLVGGIYLQPTKTAEFIILDFNILPTGATFDTGGGAGGGSY